MTTDNTDPNRVLLTGENSFIRLAVGDQETTRASHWRVLLSPVGAGHVLFIKSVPTEGVRIYADNIALARWLQGEIESLLFPEFADQSLQVEEAEFNRKGDTFSYWTETVESDDEDRISLTWYDFLEPFVITVPAGSPQRPHGVYSCFTPAKEARIIVNGEQASGRVVQEMRGERPSSTACLAWSETWVRP
jgi:hypothetical protein